MYWSKYTFSEKWKIIKSKIIHKNIVCMAMHTHDLELFKKILRIEEVKDIGIISCSYILIRGEKYYNFFQELKEYLNEKNIMLNKEQENQLNFILIHTKVFDPLNFTNDQQPQPSFIYEETLECYENFRKNSTTNHTEQVTQIEILPDLNYTELNWSIGSNH